MNRFFFICILFFISNINVIAQPDLEIENEKKIIYKKGGIYNIKIKITNRSGGEYINKEMIIELKRPDNTIYKKMTDYEIDTIKDNKNITKTIYEFFPKMTGIYKLKFFFDGSSNYKEIDIEVKDVVEFDDKTKKITKTISEDKSKILATSVKITNESNKEKRDILVSEMQNEVSRLFDKYNKWLKEYRDIILKIKASLEWYNREKDKYGIEKSRLIDKLDAQENVIKLILKEKTDIQEELDRNIKKKNDIELKLRIQKIYNSFKLYCGTIDNKYYIIPPSKKKKKLKKVKKYGNFVSYYFELGYDIGKNKKYNLYLYNTDNETLGEKHEFTVNKDGKVARESNHFDIGLFKKRKSYLIIIMDDLGIEIYQKRIDW